MSKMKSKLMLAGVLVACAFGGIAIGVAWATPGAGVTSTPIAGFPVTGRVELDEIDIVAQSPTHGVIIKTRGDWETRVQHLRIVPGGFTGWHSHPGPVFVMITKGTMTKYEADDPTTAVFYPAGTGFVEGPGVVHIAGNAEPAGDLELVAFYLIPLGAAPRIDEDAP